MYTGIVAATGRIVDVERGPADACERRLTVDCPSIAADLEPGDSVAISGACLTAETVDDERFMAGLSGETTARTWFDTAAVGDRVNLERPVRVNARLDGHIVEGTVDTTTEVLARERTPDGLQLRLELPEGYADQVVEKSTLTVEGASLTVVDRDTETFALTLVPETTARTTLDSVEPGDRVNVETNVLAKYVDRLHAGA